MLDHFLAIAYKHDQDRQDSVKLASDLKRLPNETLYALATGQSKLAFGHSDEWLEKYKGTPLFEEALTLEKSDLENQVAQQQADAARPMMDQFWKTQDQIRVQKKMLDLKLVEMQEQQGLQVGPGGQLPEVVTPAAQGAGALGDMPMEGAQDGALAAQGKMAAAIEKAAWGYGATVGGMGTRRFNAVRSARTMVQPGTGDFALAQGFSHNGEQIPGVPMSILQQNAAPANPVTKGFMHNGEMIPGVPASIAPKVAPGPAVAGKATQAELDAAAKAMQRGTLRGALGSMRTGLQNAGAATKGRLSGFMGALKSFGPKVVHASAEAQYAYNFEKAAFGIPAGLANFAKANPGALIGAGVGAAGGLAHGLRKDEHGQRHLLGGLAEGLGGAALGAGAGHAGGKFVTNYQSAVRAPMREGAGRLSAMRNAASMTGAQLKDDVNQAYGAVRGLVKKPSAEEAAFAQAVRSLGA